MMQILINKMKKIQKQYERKLRVNQNNDIFTTFQRQSHSQCSPYPLSHIRKERESQYNQHQHIESLKNTLKSLTPVPSMEITKHLEQMKDYSNNQKIEEQSGYQKYNVKLDQLAKNLQQIANKCHFSPANTTVMRQKSQTISQQQNTKYTRDNILIQKSQTISRYQPAQTELFYKYYNNTSLQVPINKSQSFMKRQESHSQSKHSNSKNKSSQYLQRNYKESKTLLQNQIIWEGKSQLRSSKKKSFSKKQMINQSLSQQHSKKLTKMFDTYNNSTELMRLKDKTGYQKTNTILMYEKIHRSKITSILITDHIYTSSLDYTVRRSGEHEGQYYSQFTKQFRGGVEHLAHIHSTIYVSSRDCYLRSLDGNFFYKFDSYPIATFQSDRPNHVHTQLFNNTVKLFDLQKRKGVCEIQVNQKCKVMQKWNKQLYLGMKGSLNFIDWRIKQNVISMIQQKTKMSCSWLSDFFSKQFCLENQGELTFYNQNLRKHKVAKLMNGHHYRTYDWNRNNLNLLSISSSGSGRLTRYSAQHSDGEQVDFQSNGQSINVLLTRQKQIIYGCKGGQLIIKQLRL